MSVRKPSPALAKARLLELCDLLESDKVKNHFNFTTWGAADSSEAGDLLEKADACGTVACALGWAPALPCAKRARIKLKLTSLPEYGLVLSNKNGAVFTIRGNEVDAEDVAMKLFGIGEEASNIIFMPGCSPFKRAPRSGASPKAVAANIRKFVAVRFG